MMRFGIFLIVLGNALVFAALLPDIDYASLFVRAAGILIVAGLVLMLRGRSATRRRARAVGATTADRAQ